MTPINLRHGISIPSFAFRMVGSKWTATNNFPLPLPTLERSQDTWSRKTHQICQEPPLPLQCQRCTSLVSVERTFACHMYGYIAIQICQNYDWKPKSYSRLLPTHYRNDEQVSPQTIIITISVLHVGTFLSALIVTSKYLLASVMLYTEKFSLCVSLAGTFIVKSPLGFGFTAAPITLINKAVSPSGEYNTCVCKYDTFLKLYRAQLMPLRAICL